MKKNIIKILSDSKVEQYPEIPVVGWIDNGDQFYKISGIIDLLYKYENEWFILDYKTDGDKSNLEKYKIQIQTYQWIVKQLFNIDAKGEIYFSALGEFISIDWNDEYFSKISDSGKRYSFTKHSGKMDLENIIEIIEQNKDEDILIINYTKYQSEIMKRQLSNDNLLSPKIRIKNLNEIIREQKVEKKRLSPSLSHLAVRKIVGEKEKRGTVKLLRDAIIENEKCDKMIVEFSDLKVVEEFEKIKAEKNLITNSDVLKIFSQSYNFSDTVVILNGIFEIDEEKFVLFKEINKGAKKFYFIDNFDNNSIKNNFNYDVSIWDKKVLLPTVKSSQNCKICYSVNEEVMELANDIMEIQNWKSKIDDMKIAVSSMDRYLPIMKKVFDEYGIPLRLITGKSLIENPIAQFIFDVIKLMQSQENWIDVREVILSPFIDDNEKYFEFDKWVRNSGIEKYYKIEERVPDNMKSLFSEIDNLLKEKFKVKNSVFDIKDKLIEFVEYIKLSENSDEKVLERVLEIAKQIPENYSIIGISGKVDDFVIDFKERLTTETMSEKNQQYGFEVLGFFDTISLQPEKLFILGMIENDFPIKRGSNPFVRKSDNNNFKREVFLFNQWQKLGQKVQFYSSEKNDMGENLQPSTFLEYLETEKVSNGGRENHYAKYYGKKIVGKDSNLIERHNDYLGVGDKKFLGKTKVDKNSENIFKVESMDNLIKCPMRYWFAHKLHLDAIDREERDEANLGILIHKILENFGRVGGFELAKTDKNKAIEKMEKIFNDTLKENNIDLKNDLLLARRYKNFTNFNDENNILIKLIDWNRERFDNYKFIEFEKGLQEEVEFGGKKMNLDLRVDKILESDDMIIATDYKTGNVKEKDVKDMLSSQFILYYLILKKIYSDKDISLVYEKIKSLKDKENGFSKFFTDSKNNSQLGKKIIKFVKDEDEGKKGKNDILLSEILEFYFMQIEKVKQGEFFITDRNEKGICDYCGFEKICRKNSVFEKNEM